MRSRTRTIDNSHDTHGPWLFRTPSIDRPNRTGNDRDTNVKNEKKKTRIARWEQRARERGSDSESRERVFAREGERGGTARFRKERHFFFFKNKLASSLERARACERKRERESAIESLLEVVFLLPVRQRHKCTLNLR